MQLAEAVHRYGKTIGVRVLPVYGGASMDSQLRALHRGVDVVVATPGRALDHVNRKSLKLEGIRTLVLDEADEMLDMGFAEDLEAILAATPSERQTALFSATLPPRIVSIAGKHLRNPAADRDRAGDDGGGEDAEGAADGLRRRAGAQAGGAGAGAGHRVADGGAGVLPDAAGGGRSDGGAEEPRAAGRVAARGDLAGGAGPGDEEAARGNARARRGDGRGGAGARHRAPVARRELRRPLLARRLRAPDRPDGAGGARGRRDHARRAARALAC